MLGQEFFCELLVRTMNVERLADRLVGTADEGLECPSTVGPLDEFADELGDGDTAFGGSLGCSGSDMIGQLNDHRHEVQRTHGSQKDRTSFAAVQRWAAERLRRVQGLR